MTSAPEDRSAGRPNATGDPAPADESAGFDDPAAAAEAGNAADSPGHVVFDRRGNPVWEWNAEGDDSTSVLLRKLDNDLLALEPTRKTSTLARRAPAGTGGGRADRGLELADDDGGFNPYDRS